MGKINPLAPATVEPILTGAQQRRLLLAGLGMPTVKAIEQLLSLPEGVYPSRVIGMIMSFELNGVETLFSSKHGFKLNDDKTGIVVVPNSHDEKEWADETIQVGFMLEVVSGKYVGKHIPVRFNLTGYAVRADFDSKEWDSAGYVEKDKYACQVNPDGSFTRVVSEKRSEQGRQIFGKAIGACLHGVKIEGAEPDQFDLEDKLINGEEVLVNSVLKKDLNDPKGRIVPMFFNPYDEDKSTFPDENPVVESEDDEV